MKRILFLLSFLLFAVPAYSAQYYVATTGNNAASGAIGAPWLTAQKCATTAVAGDTCNFRTGTYGGFTPAASGTSVNPIIFKNYNSEVVTLSTTTVGGTCVAFDIINLSGRSYITIDGLLVDAHAAIVGIESCASDHITIQNSSISYAYGTGVGIYQTNTALVQNCKIFENSYSNWPHGAYVMNGDWGAGMIASQASSNITFKDNFIYHNHGEGVTAGSSSSYVTFDGNVISDNWSVNLYMESSNNLTAKNNIIYNTDTNINDVSCTASCFDQNPDGIALATGDNSYGTTDLTNIYIFNNVITHSGLQIDRFTISGSSRPDSNWFIYNNTFILNTDPGIRLGSGASSLTNINIRNNIFQGTLSTSGATYGFINVALVPVSKTISNNVYHSTNKRWIWNGTNYTTYATWAAVASDSSSIESDPLLISASTTLGVLWSGTDPTTIKAAVTAAFGLTSTSPVIDIGVDTSTYLTNDIAGIDRPKGAAYDIGAFEFNGGGGSTPPPSTIIPDSVCTGTSSGASITFSCTVAVQTNRFSVLLVSIGTTTGTTITSSNYNGDPFGSQQCVADAIAGGTELFFSGYTLIAPDTGTHTVTVNLSNTPAAASAAMLTFYNVDQTTGYRASNSNTGSGVSTSLVVNSAAGDLMVDGVYEWGSNSTVTPGTGQTALYSALQVGSDPDYMRSSDKLATGTSTAMSWSWPVGNGGRYGVCGFSLIPNPTSQPNFKNVFLSPVVR